MFICCKNGNYLALNSPDPHECNWRKTLKLYQFCFVTLVINFTRWFSHTNIDSDTRYLELTHNTIQIYRLMIVKYSCVRVIRRDYQKTLVYIPTRDCLHWFNVLITHVQKFVFRTIVVKSTVNVLVSNDKNVVFEHDSLVGLCGSTVAYQLIIFVQKI